MVQRLHHRQTRRGDMAVAQKAEKMLLRIIKNVWLCNVQLFPKVWIIEISRKAFRISRSCSKAVFGYPYPVSSEISDFTPSTHAQSNILYTKYADETDY